MRPPARRVVPGGRHGALDDELTISAPAVNGGPADDYDNRADPPSWFGRYRDPAMTPLEFKALEWLDGFYELEHLLATRQWAMKLRPQASPELCLAALVHDAERYFPGGPTNTPSRFDDPSYLFAHSIRSAEFVDSFLAEIPGVDDEFRYQVRCLVLRHEVGGGTEADVLQAADSLSFLETLPWLTVEWVQTGRYPVEMAMAKHHYMLTRMRPAEAMEYGLPLYEQAISQLKNAAAVPLDGRRQVASDFRLLLGLRGTNDV
jgi:hypothetical protein